MGIATGQFLYTNGSPVANGLYQWKLSQDAIEFGGTTACIAPPLIIGNLDTNGNMTATFAFNDVLSTTAGLSTTYQLTVKDLGGGQVWNERYYLTGTAANINTIPPGGSGIIVTTPVTNIVLQTNGVTNSVQNLENLVAGTGITLSNAAGATTFNAAAASGGFLQTATGAAGFFGPGFDMQYMLNVNGLQNFSAAANSIIVAAFNLNTGNVIRKVSFFSSNGNATATNTQIWGFSVWDSLIATKLIDSGPMTFSVGAASTNAITPVTLSAGAYVVAQT